MLRPALALLAVAALSAGGCGADDPSAGEQRAEQARAAALDAGLSDEVADVVATAARSVDATYRAVFEAPAPDGGPPSRSVVTQRPPDRRVDLLGLSEDDTQSTILRDGVTNQCRQESGAWRCDQLGRPAEGGPFDPESVATAVDALTSQQGDYDLRVEERPMLGVTARCLIAEAPGGEAPAASLCLSPEGVVLSIDAASGTLEAVEYSTEVPDDAFDLPTERATDLSSVPTVDEPEVWRWIWLIGAVGFGLGEIATAGTFFLMPFGIGAAVAAVLAFAGVNVAVQWLVFLVVSLVLLAAMRPLARRLDRDGLTEGIGSRRLIGESATVLDAIPAGPNELGLVRVHREEWRAESVTGDAVPAGILVRVVDQRGTRLVVAPSAAADLPGDPQ